MFINLLNASQRFHHHNHWKWTLLLLQFYRQSNFHFRARLHLLPMSSPYRDGFLTIRSSNAQASTSTELSKTCVLLRIGYLEFCPTFLLEFRISVGLPAVEWNSICCQNRPTGRRNGARGLRYSRKRFEPPRIHSPVQCDSLRLSSSTFSFALRSYAVSKLFHIH